MEIKQHGRNDDVTMPAAIPTLYLKLVLKCRQRRVLLANMR